MRDAPIVNVRLYDKGLAAKYQRTCATLPGEYTLHLEASHTMPLIAINHYAIDSIDISITHHDDDVSLYLSISLSLSSLGGISHL